MSAGYLLRRAALAVLIVASVATLVFVLIHLAPGDPFAAAMENPNVTSEVRDRWRAAYGLDAPIGTQYVRYMGGLARGDLGWSFSRQQPVSAVLGSALPNTLVLVGSALLLSFLAGIALALFQARRKGSVADRLLGGTSIVLLSLPDFWLGIILLLAFSYWIPLLPVGGVVDAVMHPYMGPADQALDRLRHLILPLATLTLGSAAAIARYQRAALLDVLPRDFMRTARAKGVPERDILRHHGLRNALMPAITLLGASLPALIGGVVFVEKVFAWPGMGMVAVDAVSARDYPLVMATVILATVIVVAGNLLADVLYAVADPRIRG